MELWEVVGALDSRVPFWVNDGNDSERFDEYDNTMDNFYCNSDWFHREVKYITLDGNGELTIEI